MCGKREIFYENTSWVSAKAAVILAMIFILPVDTSAMAFASNMPLKLVPLYKLTSYVLFILNTAYFGMFYADLEQMSKARNRFNSREYSKMNRSTF